MITMHASDVDNLLHQGRIAAQHDDWHAARQHFRLATELAPDCAVAWVGLAQVVPMLAERRTYLQRAIELDSFNQESVTYLRMVDALLSGGHYLDPSVQQSNSYGWRNVTAASVDEPEPSLPRTTCYNHPDRETGLHCTQCNQPICSACSVPAAVGQLCQTCASSRRPANYQVSAHHVAIATPLVMVLAAILSTIEVVVMTQLPIISFFLYALVVPPTAGLMVRLLDYATHGKRGKVIQRAVVIGMCVGVLPILLLTLVFISPLDAILLLVFMVFLVSATTAQLR